MYLPKVYRDERQCLLAYSCALNDHQDPAQTYTPINLWDLTLAPGCATDLIVLSGYNKLFVVLCSAVQGNGEELLRDACLAQFNLEGTGIQLEANNAARVWLRRSAREPPASLCQAPSGFKTILRREAD